MTKVVLGLVSEKAVRDPSYKRRTSFAEAGGYPVLLACVWSDDAATHGCAMEALANALDDGYRQSEERAWYLQQTVTHSVKQCHC